MGLGFQHASTISVFMHKCIHYCCYRLPAPATETRVRVFDLNEMLYVDGCVDIHFIVNNNVNKILSYFLYSWNI